MKARIEFETRLAEVNACAQVLRDLVNVEKDTGFTADKRLLLDVASRLAWANNYLTVASLALIAEVGVEPFVAPPMEKSHEPL